MSYETGARSHLDRMGLTNRLCEMLEPLFDDCGISYSEYGQNIIVRDNPKFQARLKKLDVKKSDVVNMVKFAPDFLLFHSKSGLLFMLDAKVSITPMFFPSAINTLRHHTKDWTLDRYRIGEVEREAWDNYNHRFPRNRVAICMAAPYSPQVLHVEWATRLKGLFRFEEDSNELADGSGTPHVNIDMGKMRTLDQFLAEEMKIAVDQDLYQDILNEVKQWPLNKPGRVNWTQFNNVILASSAKCPWLHGRIPSEHAQAERYREAFESAGLTLDEFKANN